MKKALSLILVLVMLLGMMPMTAFAANEESDISTQNPFAGKTVSILSASTSTYAGVSNNTAANSTIGKNDVYYTEGRHGVYLKDTWWQQVIDALDMRLLVNNSWSGSCVFQPRKGAASIGYEGRAVNLHNDHTGEEPDIIWVYIGCNDFAYFKDTFGKAADVDYSALIKDNGDGTFDYTVPTTTCEAYAIMLHKIQTRYPDAEVYCFTTVGRRDPDYAEDNRPDPGQPTEYSAELIQVAEHFACTVIDWENCIPKEAELFDKYIADKRAHPNADGMDLMSQAAISGMLGKETTLYDVSGTYTGVETDNTAAAAIEGMAYQAKLTAGHGSTLDVTVTMGGVDVTQSVYSNGTIYIENVTGDIKITAVAYRAPQEFRWEVVDGTLTSTGKNKNTLTALAESISDGVITEGKYQFATPVTLKHDCPWVMEWKCSGNWRGILLATNLEANVTGRSFLARTKGGQLIIGTWDGKQNNNYGVDLSKLDAQSHTYRLENRIAADGSNMVWLYLDGAEIGPMNNYFIGSKDQNKTSDWVSGKDFVFPYIGMDTTPVTNCQLDYLSVTECAHTYQNGTCTVCGATQPGPVITQQPESVQQEVGKKFAITVKAEGEGLTYQWYVKENGAKAFKISSNKTASYAYTMAAYMHNRQVYCVVTDANGNSVQTETATISRPPQTLKILQQPQDARVNVGEKFSISPKVEGEGLIYQWYVKENGAKAFKVSSVRGSAYALTMQKYMIGRQVYCVITDKYGNSVTTDVATISLPPVELKILEQPSDVYASKGEKFSISPKVQGEGLTYQWYYKEGYMKNFKPSSNKTSAYAYSMQLYMNERSVYCVITDKFGNQVQTEAVTIYLGNLIMK